MGLNWRWVLGAILLYVVLLVAYLPAAQVIHRLPLPANVSIIGVDGRIWQGSAERVQFNSTVINDVSWDVAAWSLLTGQLKGELSAGNRRDA